MARVRVWRSPTARAPRLCRPPRRRGVAPWPPSRPAVRPAPPHRATTRPPMRVSHLRARGLAKAPVLLVRAQLLLSLQRVFRVRARFEQKSRARERTRVGRRDLHARRPLACVLASRARRAREWRPRVSRVGARRASPACRPPVSAALSPRGPCVCAVRVSDC